MALLDVLPVVGKLLDKVIPDPAARDAAKLELLRLEQSGELEVIRGQTAVNLEEARNASVFVSGWRPALGWACVVAFSYSVLILPVLSWLSAINGWGAPVEIDTGSIVTLLFGMLGLAGARTVEKLQGVARK